MLISPIKTIRQACVIQTGCPTAPTVPGACVLDGEHPINAPLWKTYLGLAYTQPVDWGDVYGRIDWSWTDNYNTSFSADPRLIQNPLQLDQPACRNTMGKI